MVWTPRARPVKPEEKVGKFDGLNRETKALEEEVKPGKYDGLDTKGEAHEA